MELDAGAGGLRRDAVRVGQDVLGAVDLDLHVLAAGSEDLLVEHPVPLTGRQGVRVHIGLGQRRQDADHHQPAARSPGLLVARVQAAPDLAFQIRQGIAAQLTGRHVDLQVELAYLRRPGRIRDRREHVSIPHRRRALLIDKVQLDLLAHQRRAGVEQPLAQHPGKHVERAR